MIPLAKGLWKSKEEVRLINLGSVKSGGSSVVGCYVCVHVHTHVGDILEAACGSYYWSLVGTNSFNYYTVPLIY